MIRFEGLCKNFPGVQAVRDVSFQVQTGHCHAILGENGAGKSTLGKMLAGIYRPTRGRILIDEKPLQFYTPRHAIDAGIAIVHQELVFAPNLSVAENLCLHALPKKRGMLDRVTMRKTAEELLELVGLEVDVTRKISTLSIAQEQLVQIAAAMGMKAKVVIFDEPTSSLTQTDVDNLFTLIRKLQAEGTTILYISHRLEEIFEICQQVTVLRDGEYIDTKPIEAVSRDDLVKMMVGREVKDHQSSLPARPQTARLEVRKFTSPGKFSQIDMKVYAGEIVGVAGLIGAGRSEMAEAIFGLDPQVQGEILINDRVVHINSPDQAMKLGIGFVPEDRKRQGLVLPMSVRENMTLPIVYRFRHWFLGMDIKAEKKLTNEYKNRLSIQAPNGEATAESLSGGNQQKIVLAKWIAAGGKILIIDEPTRGVDVGAKQEIHQLIDELAQQGVAVLVISSDLPELLGLATRVIVLREGEKVAELSREEATAETVVRYMTGITPPQTAQ